MSSLIAKEIENPSFQQTLAEVDAAAARPRFADACPLTYAVDCNVMNLLGYHHVAAVAILGSALRDDWEAALKRLEAHLKAQLDLAASSRGLLTTTMAGAQIDDSVALVRLVLAGLSHEKAPVPAAGLKSIAALLEAAPDEGGERRAVMCHYLYTVSAIRLLAPNWRPEGTAPSVSGTSGDWLQRFTLDPDHTLELANTYYTSVMAAVDGTSPGAVPELDPEGSLLWWLYNPAGKMLLRTDTTLPFHLPRLAAQRAKSLALRKEVRKELLDLVASEPHPG